MFSLLLTLLMTSLTTLNPGDQAPDFTAEATDGSHISLHDYKGKSNVVLYFYPEDMTSGCTVEACSFRDDNSKFKDANTVILGVSLDDRQKHQQFTDMHGLNFPLLVDTNREICTAYGVPIDGHQPHRWTFLIDRNGKIAKIYDKVKVREHSAELLADIANLPK